MTNLIQRSITGLVLLAGVVVALTSLTQLGVVLLIALVGGILLFEYASLTQLSKVSTGMTTVILVLILTLGWQYSYAVVADIQIFFWLVCIWWLYNLVIVVQYPKQNTLINHRLFQPMNALLLLTPFVLVFPYLHAYSTPLLGLLLVIVISVDSCSYIVGKLFGTHTPLPQLSPHKTTQGFIGGIIGGTGISLLYTYIMITTDLGKYGIIIVLTALFALIGDGYQSVFKRIRGVKNSGTLLPGHGGLWDRLDGMLAATPIFILGILVLEL